MNTTRIYGRLSGAELIALIGAGDEAAVLEAENHRSVPSVKAAVRAYRAEHPAPKKTTRKASAKKATAPKATPIRPKAGPGSRGGDPYKALARVQTKGLPTFSPEQRVAYNEALSFARSEYTPAQALKLAQKLAA